MKSSLRQFDRTPTGASVRTLSARAGFTMIELLVAVSILVILTTLTVSAFNVNDADRVSNSIGTFKNALEGARSRAINSGEVRGLRLIVDPNNGRMVKSMVYIGSAGTDEGTGGLNYESANQRWVFRSNVTDDSLGWAQLIDRSLIVAGGRIEIPANSGRWYSIIRPEKNYNSTSNEVVILAGHYHPNRASGATSFSAIPATNLSYRLELSPTILDGADPILLDPQTCVDMDGSFVPGDWRPGLVDDAYGVDSVSGTAQLTSMDILFAPDGTVTGGVKTFGVVRLRFAYVSDVILAENFSGRPLIKATTPPTPIVPLDPEKAHKALSIFSQTGGIIITEIDPTPTSTPLNGGFNNDVASQPFSYALLGKESN